MSIANLLARCCDEPTLLEEKHLLQKNPLLKNILEVEIINDALTVIYNGRKEKP
jgi:hypothetical protein